MDYIQGTPREHKLLFPDVIDNYITEDNPVLLLTPLLISWILRNLHFENCSLLQLVALHIIPETYLNSTSMGS